MTKTTWIILICTIISALAVVFVWLDWGRKKVKCLWRFFSRQKSRIPKETIKVVNHDRGNWWSLGKMKDKPAMQISSHLYVTNITDKNVKVLSVEILKPRKAKKYCVKNWLLTKHHRGDIYGKYWLLPNMVSELSIDLWIQPPIIKEDDDLKLSVVLTDQYGNKHKIKRLIFESRNKKKISKSEEESREIPKEVIYKIENEIEKEVAAILKVEVERYNECGRRVGGLGSVRLNDSEKPGIGTEWRKADSPTNQSIDPNPKKEYIISENAQALINLFSKLKNKEDKSIFIKSLLDRLSKDKEYSSIGYLTFLVLFRIGKLEMCFDVAKEKLYKDSAHGFSDSLRLLDGLLRFEHSLFSKDQLEKIEAFIDSLDEHLFRIPERLFAIRAFRHRQESKK